jgi:alkaline phosphatase
VRDAAGIREVVEFATGVALDVQELDILVRLSRGERVHPFEAFNGLYGVLGGILSKHSGVAFATPHHTGDLVEVLAVGPASEGVTGVIANTDLHALVCGAMELPTA